MTAEEVNRHLMAHAESDSKQFAEIKNSLQGITQNQVRLAESQTRINDWFEKHMEEHERMLQFNNDMASSVKSLRDNFNPEVVQTLNETAKYIGAMRITSRFWAFILRVFIFGLVIAIAEWAGALKSIIALFQNR